jgi:RHS repeat-associated protein
MFTGHEREYMGTQPDVSPLEGLDYMHARYYSAGLGRFLSVDPVPGSIGSSQSWNRYGYVHNNPVNLTDPLGLKAQPCGEKYGLPCFAEDDEIVVTAKDPGTDKDPDTETTEEQEAEERDAADRYFLQFTLASQQFHEREDRESQSTKTPSPNAPDANLSEIGNWWASFEHFTAPFVVGGSAIISGAAVATSGLVLTGAIFAAAPESFGLSLLAAPAGLAVTGAGFYTIGFGTTAIMNHTNNLLGTHMPTLSDYGVYPDWPPKH